MKKLIFLISATALISTTAYPILPLLKDSISTDIKWLSKEEAAADINYMIGYVNGTHPEMFAEYPQETFMQKADEIKESLPDSVDIPGFYLRIAKLLPLLGDGHTGLDPESVFDRIEDKTGFPWFPKLNPADSSAYIPEIGGRIISINGIPVKNILGEMMEYVSGESPAFRLVRIEEHFPFYMKMLYPAPLYNINYIKDVDQKTSSIEAVAAETGFKKGSSSDTDSPVPYSYSVMEDISACLLEFNEFRDVEGFAVFLEGMFSEMEGKNIRNLIIDLRRNGGGDSSLGDELFQYISPVPFAQFGDVTARISPNLLKAYPHWDMEPEDSVYHYPQSDEDLQELRNNPLRYAGKGDVYVLTGANTFSSATDFTWAFQYFKMGTVVGEETGGHIVCFGDLINTTLPHSGIRLFCSWKKFYGYGATDEYRHPVIPDHYVPAEDALRHTTGKLIERNNI